MRQFGVLNPIQIHAFATAQTQKACLTWNENVKSMQDVYHRIFSQYEREIYDWKLTFHS